MPVVLFDKKYGREYYTALGLSLLNWLLSVLALCLAVIPIISIPLILVLSLGMSKLLYEGYLGERPASEQLFIGFKSGLVRNCCAMAWMLLWVFIWGLIPAAGFFLAVYKFYSYRFVPYILLTRPEVSATEALRISIKETQGYKGLMFGTEIIVILAVALIILLFSLLALIPLIGWVFKAVLLLVLLAFAAFLPLLFGLLSAAFYTETHREADSAPASDTIYAPLQGHISNKEYADDDDMANKTTFCFNCGFPLDDGQLFLR
jgi:hypothetical protein